MPEILPYSQARLRRRQDPRSRFIEPCKPSRRRTHIGSAIHQYGRKNAVFETLVAGHPEYILDLEIKAIACFNTRWPNGYNLAPGGFGYRGGLDELPVTRAKRSANTCGKKNPSWGKPAGNRGRSPSTATQAKQAAAKRGIKFPPRSPEHCAHLAASLRGKSFTPERIENITAAQRRRRLREAGGCGD